MMSEPSETDQLYLDIFTTAIEGGIGYWSQCAACHWSKRIAPDDHVISVDDHYGFYADIFDMENDDKPHHIDRSVIVRGYALACEMRDQIGWSTGPPPLIITAESRDEWDFDAGDADAIVQLGLFGELVYG